MNARTFADIGSALLTAYEEEVSGEAYFAALAEQHDGRARDCGMDITYAGIRLTPAEIVAAAAEQEVHVVGMSVLSGSHLPLIAEVMDRMRMAGLSDVPVVVGGIIPEEDAEKLRALGVEQIYTPKDFELNRIMLDIVGLVDARSQAAE